MSTRSSTTYVVFTLPTKFAGAVESHQEDLRARGLSGRTMATYEERLRDFGRYLQSRELDIPAVTPFVVRQYLNHLRDRGNLRATRNPRPLSPHTVEDHYVALKALRTFLLRSRLIKSDFMEGVLKPKVPSLPPVFIPEDALRRAFAFLDPKRPPKGYPRSKWHFLALRNRAALTALLDSMVRNSELRGLRVEDVDFGAGVLTVTRKGGKVARVPFSLQTVKALKPYLKARQDRFRLPYDRGPLFLTLDGKPLTRTGLRAMFRMLKVACGIQGRFFPHAIRHTGAKLALKGGADVFSLAKVLGHRTLAVTRRYAELDEEEVARQHRVWSPATRLLGE